MDLIWNVFFFEGSLYYDVCIFSGTTPYRMCIVDGTTHAPRPPVHTQKMDDVLYGHLAQEVDPLLKVESEPPWKQFFFVESLWVDIIFGLFIIFDRVGLEEFCLPIVSIKGYVEYSRGGEIVCETSMRFIIALKIFRLIVMF